MKELSNLTKSTTNTSGEKMKGYLKNLLIIVLLLIVFISNTENKETTNKLNEEIQELKIENTDLSLALNKTLDAFNEQFNEIQDCVSVIDELDKQNLQLVEEKNEVYEKLDQAEQQLADASDRLQTYEKYEYAVFYGGKRTDLTYEQLKTGEQLMAQNGLDPNLLFSTIMVESTGNSKAKNTRSTATGYGQFLYGTGKFVYEDLMGNGKGTYSRDKALDGDTNIKMMAEYMNYLVDKSKKRNGGNTLYAAIKSYRGVGGPVLNQYIGMIDKYMRKGGTSFVQVSMNIK